MSRVVWNTETGMYSWERGPSQPLSPHFSTREFDCHCGTCVVQTVSKELVDKLEAIRAELGAPLGVSSGYRCADYQARLRGQGLKTAGGTSTHEQGKAADIFTARMSDLYPITEKHFKAIGLAPRFLHVDLRADKVRRWNY